MSGIEAQYNPATGEANYCDSESKAMMALQNVWKLTNDNPPVVTWPYYTGGYRGWGIAVDGEGNVVVAGTQNDALNNVWKLDSLGALIWEHDIGQGSGWQPDAYGIAVDVNLNVYIIGTHVGSPINATGHKLNAAGVLQTIYETGKLGQGVAVDSNGNVIIVGFRKSTAPTRSVWKFDNAGNFLWSYDTGSGTEGVAVDGSGNIYVAGSRTGSPLKSEWKLDSAENLLWSYDTGGGALSIAVDNAGNVYVGGASSGYPDYYTLWKLDSAGDLVWALSTHEGRGGGETQGVAVDNAGFVYAATRRATVGEVHKYTDAGVLVYHKVMGQIYFGMSGIAVEKDGTIYVTGETTPP